MLRVGSAKLLKDVSRWITTGGLKRSLGLPPGEAIGGNGEQCGRRESRQEHQFWQEMMDTWSREWWVETKR